MTVRNATFDLMQFTKGNIQLDELLLENIAIKRRFIILNEANLVLNATTIIGLSATGIAPLCTADKGSILLLLACTFQHFTSREQNMMLLSGSFLTIQSSWFADFNATVISANRGSVEIINTEVRRGGLKYGDLAVKTQKFAGFLDCEDCDLRVYNSFFYDISGGNGGVFSHISTLRAYRVLIQYSEFHNCSAQEDGGALYILGSNMDMTGAVFRNCEARRGGGVYFECENREFCAGNITNSEFSFNTAREGAGFRWTQVRPTLNSLIFPNNSAIYGPLEASIPTHMQLISSNDTIMRGVAGVKVERPILLAFLDAINQTVLTDNSSTAELLSNSLIGTTSVVAQSGIANFSGIIVQSFPDFTLQIDVFSTSILSTGSLSNYSFAYYVRSCVPGEISSATGCYPCPKNTFSVDPNEPDCRACPSYASCPGANILDLAAGYWRTDQLSSWVHVCPIKYACSGGQNSLCEDGYTGKLCSQCVDGYYMAGLTYCIQCESLPIRLTLAIIFCIVFTIFITVLIRNSIRNQRTLSTVTTMKILLNFLQTVIMVSTITVDWRSVMMSLYSVNEMFSSVAVTSFTLECYSGEGVEPVYMKAVLASVVPIVLVACNWGVFAIARLIKGNKYWKLQAFQGMLMLLYMLHPYIVKSAISLITCKEIEGNSKWLTANSSIECWQGAHILYANALFLPMFLIYVLGIPLLLLASVMRLRLSERRHVITFFTSGYTAARNYWELVVMARKTVLLIALGLLGSSETRIQMLVGLILLYLCLAVHCEVYPYITLLHNRLETASLFILTILGGFSFYFMAELSVNSTILLIISFAIMIQVLLFILICLLILLITAFFLRKKSTIVPQLPEAPISPLHPNPPNTVNSSIMVLKQNSSIIR
jgi:hypothetical protein